MANGLRALTVWQPWAWGLTVGIKPMENRTWAPPLSALGTDLAIHAGKRPVLADDADQALAFRDIVRRPEVGVRFQGPWPTWAEVPLGAVTAVVLLAGAVHESGRRVGNVSEARAREILADPFWCGPWGWVCEDVRALAEPVPCRGAQGLWALPAEVERLVMTRVGGEGGRDA